jgi:hypothetical protein
MVAPTPELSDDTPIERVLFSIRIQTLLRGLLATSGLVGRISALPRRRLTFSYLPGPAAFAFLEQLD